MISISDSFRVAHGGSRECTRSLDPRMIKGFEPIAGFHRPGHNVNFSSSLTNRRIDANWVQRRMEIMSASYSKLGGNGYTNEYPTGRLSRDAKLYQIGAGT